MGQSGQRPEGTEGDGGCWHLCNRERVRRTQLLPQDEVRRSREDGGYSCHIATPSVKTLGGMHCVVMVDVAAQAVSHSDSR
jgi:hypothetical protein